MAYRINGNGDTTRWIFTLMIDGIEFNSSTLNPLTTRRAERMRQRLTQLGLTWVEVQLDSSIKAGRLFPKTQKAPRRK